MKIVADENIAFLDHYFGNAGILVKKPGRDIVREDLLNADLLLVRSVTTVDQALLHNTAIKFVGSATAGFDHIDIAWLEKNNIPWRIAKGSNATAVSEYVIAVVAALQNHGYLKKNSLRAGVIGVGQIGTQVVEKLKILGYDVIHYDPVRAENEKDFASTSLENFTDLDFITLHIPLTHDGAYPTYHLIQKDFLLRQKPHAILLNTARGASIDFSELKQYGKHVHWCLDVWEHEPEVDQEVLEKSVIATPHIAGYSSQAKLRGTQMIYQAAVELGMIAPVRLSLDESKPRDVAFQDEILCWQDVVLKIFDPMSLTMQMKSHAKAVGKNFDKMRKHFVRDEFAAVRMREAQMPRKDTAILRQLGIIK